MDITAQDNTATQPISDDQELAKALAGVLPDNPTTANQASTPGALQFEETPVTTVVNGGVPPLATITQTPPVDPVTADPSAASVGPESFDAPAADPTPATSPTESLDVIKSTALSELRPLIDHVDLPAEEKFDTYLMLIRSTDDTSLIAPAHSAAQQIGDEKRKAEALLDIIKEIDYLSRKDQLPPL